MLLEISSILRHKNPDYQVQNTRQTSWTRRHIPVLLGREGAQGLKMVSRETKAS